MKLLNILSIVALGVIVSSCNSGIDNSEDKAAATPAPASLPQQSPIALPSSGTTASLNPAHGQPGHNCDLPVGAPMNGAVVKSPVPLQGAVSPITLPANGANVPAGNITPQPIQIAPAPSIQSKPITNSTARLNPAHGQPGHDCNVAVGQPLKN